MRLPSGAIVFISTPIYEGSNFTWGEATKNCSRSLEDLWINGVRIITAQQIEKNIVLTAIAMDAYREKLGNRPIIVTSWYRPQLINLSGVCF